jgi:hypothetical protein
VIKKILVNVIAILFFVGAITLLAQGVKNPITQEQRDEWAKIGQEKAPQYIESFDQAKALAIKEGKATSERGVIVSPDGTPVEMEFKCNLYKLGGIGENGFWTFYTIKYFPQVDGVVIVVYKPESGSVVILRQDTDVSQQKVYSVYIEENHSSVTWGFIHTDGRTADGFVKVFLRPMASLLTDSQWGFTPTDEMRHGECWEIKPKEGVK